MFNKLKDTKMNAEMAADDTKFWITEFWTSFRNHWKKILIAIPLLILALWWSIAWVLKTDEIVTITNTETKLTGVELVQQKDPKTGKMVEVQKNVDTYFVYTDKGAFQFKPSIFFLQWEVADRFGMLQQGKTYKITHYGFRNSFFDWYENIVDFEEVDPKTNEPVKK